MAKRFFYEHKKHCELRALEDDDFETLIRLCLTSDSVLIGGESYKQKSGLAMGNNLAPSLAIIYMNELDSLIVSKAEGQVILKRYMDDYFAFFLSACLSAQSLLTTANSLNDKIKFTIETPYNNELPLWICSFRLTPNPEHFPPSFTLNLYTADLLCHGIVTALFPPNEQF